MRPFGQAEAGRNFSFHFPIPWTGRKNSRIVFRITFRVDSVGLEGNISVVVVPASDLNVTAFRGQLILIDFYFARIAFPKQTEFRTSILINFKLTFVHDMIEIQDSR